MSFKERAIEREFDGYKKEDYRIISKPTRGEAKQAFKKFTPKKMGGYRHY